MLGYVNPDTALVAVPILAGFLCDDSLCRPGHELLPVLTPTWESWLIVADGPIFLVCSEKSRIVRSANARLEVFEFDEERKGVLQWA